MAIKYILCIFGGSENELNAVQAALMLGKEHEAHIRFLHLSPDPGAHSGLYGEGVLVSSEIVAAIENENKARLEAAKRHISAMTAKYHIPLDGPQSPAHRISASFRHLTGNMDRLVAREGRVCDLIIMGKNDTMKYDTMTPALFNTGRPVLLIPSIKGTPVMSWNERKVAIAWDGGMEAARALYNALPLVRKSKAMHLLVAREHGKAFDLEAQQIVMEYLNAHGFHPNIVVADRGDRSIGETLLEKVKELGSDLLIMGAYGHSMFREMVLGGVTEHVLSHGDIPIFLSH